MLTFPRDPDKHDQPSIVSPEALAAHGLEHGAYATITPPRAAIMLYHRGLAQQVLDGRSATKVPGFFGDTYLLEETGGEVAIVADFGIGAPAAAVILEDLIALGCRTVLSVGTCGGMDESLEPGDLVVVTGAVRDEGTSYHYLPAGVEVAPDPDLAEALAQVAERRGLQARRGSTWTTDAPYRETAREVHAHRAAGVPVVEMEAAALLAVAQVRHARVASLLVVSDVLDALDGSWVPEFHGDVVGASLQAAVACALDVARVVR